MNLARFIITISRMNVPNKALILMALLDVFVETVERAFPCLWKYLCHLRNVKGDRTVEEEPLIPICKQQVRVQLIALNQMHNPLRLV